MKGEAFILLRLSVTASVVHLIYLKGIVFYSTLPGAKPTSLLFSGKGTVTVAYKP